MTEQESHFHALMATYASEFGQFARRWGYRVDDIRAEIAAAVWAACVAGQTGRSELHRSVEQHIRAVARTQVRAAAVAAVIDGRELQTSLLQWRGQNAGGRPARLLFDATRATDSVEEQVVERLDAKAAVARLPQELVAWADPTKRAELSRSERNWCRSLRRALTSHPSHQGEIECCVTTES